MKSIFQQILDLKISNGLIVVILFCEFILSLVIVKYVAYTEIDWIAYMQEVEGYLGGERDYLKLQGDTGPLVYPAGFLYIFSLLRSLTDNGTNLLMAQYIFVGIYLFNLLIVLKLYQNTKSIPLIACVTLVLSKRVHSIYMLRMFNDCIAVLFGYVAFYLFINDHWKLGSFFYSTAVSIKMNMLLYAPGLLLIYLMKGGITHAILCIGICALVQLIYGLPFLTTFPLSYLQRSFELGRVFQFKWTVNFKFLPEEIFVSKTLSISLLIITIIAFIIFAFRWINQLNKGIQEMSKQSKPLSILNIKDLSPQFIIYTLFASNIIGIVFARSLHYQFYCWYFHTIPFLLWNSRLPYCISIFVLLGIEISFNVYPATPWSSLVLQLCHFVILGAIYFSNIPYHEGKRLGIINSKRN